MPRPCPRLALLLCAVVPTLAATSACGADSEDETEQGAAGTAAGGASSTGGSGTGGATTGSGTGGNLGSGGSGTGGNLGSGGSGSGGEITAMGGVVQGSGGEVVGTGGVLQGSGGEVVGTGGVIQGSGGDSGTGGDGTGGNQTGGTTGACQQSSCGSHKWACWPVPNPASSPDNVPNHQSYTDLGNGAVRDDITCLVWEKENPSASGTWQDSYDRCASLAASGFAGFNDWRLPTRMEMASITDVTQGRTGYAPIFSVTSGYYTTGSFWYHQIRFGSEEYDQVWGYGTNGFTSNAISGNGTDLVARCVRGNGDGEAADEYAVEPPDHYSIGTDTVTDNYTGLTWQRGRSPSLMSWEEAPAYCAGLTLDGLDGWRVPTLNELASTVNEALVGGAIVESAFPDNPNGCREPQYWFWAAEASQVGGTAWGLSYCDGFTGWNVGSSGDWNYFPTANVRCVR